MVTEAVCAESHGHIGNLPFGSFPLLRREKPGFHKQFLYSMFPKLKNQHLPSVVLNKLECKKVRVSVTCVCARMMWGCGHMYHGAYVVVMVRGQLRGVSSLLPPSWDSGSQTQVAR